MSKLTEKQVLQMRHLRAAYKMPLQELAQRFNVARSTVGHITRGDLGVGWKSVGGPLYKRKYRRASCVS